MARRLERTNETGEECDRGCHRSVNHSHRAGIYLHPRAILDFSNGRPAQGGIHCERTTLPLCHVLQTLLFFSFLFFFFCFNRGLVFHLSKYIFLLPLREQIFMTEEVSAMAGGLVFAGCLSVPFCKRHISGTPAASSSSSFLFFFNSFSLQNLQG